MVLLGICRRLKKEEEISSGDARLYELVCEENNESLVGTRLSGTSEALESQGLIVSRASSSLRGRGGHSTSLCPIQYLR